ncbi:MAG: hypothetical protein HFJ18_02445 [Clostridia bacterium]|nr:hypothetical protein [Clostridia bacterium]
MNDCDYNQEEKLSYKNVKKNLENKKIEYTIDNNSFIFNIARKKAFNTLNNTLVYLYGKNNISEKEFKDIWQNNLNKETDIIADGWYNPPPKGMSILFGDRASFDSLRNRHNWASDTIINWNSDLLYAYCSPIDKLSGIIGDIAITLYFGNNIDIINHIKNCHDAVLEIFNKLNTIESSKSLFELSQQVFLKHKLKNCIISKTDNTPLDLGHTFPRLNNLTVKNKLTEDQNQEISRARKFINENTDWNFTEGMQFTIEPQLISIENHDLPQISQHYLIKKTKDNFIICNDIDLLLKKYQLI